jgi:probable F420-dependent oxidoreductase
MHIGLMIRNMGDQSTREIMAGAALAAEDREFESIWVVDHIAIPPEDSEGSGGRYVDILTSLAWLAGLTSTIKLGSGVLIAPYREILPTAKQIASIQELSGNRLLLGIGLGWMDAEFKALGVDRKERGKKTDELLTFLHEAFSQDEVELNEQKFLFKPRPTKPPFYIAGSKDYSIKRAVKHGDGWIPIVNEPEEFEEDLRIYRDMCDSSNKASDKVNVVSRLNLDDEALSKEKLTKFEDMGIERLVCGLPYKDLDDFLNKIDFIKSLIN